MAKQIIFLLCALLLTFSTAFSQEKWDLESCIVYALEHNIQVQQSENNLKGAQYSYTQAKLDVLPSLNFQGSHGYNFGQTIDPFTNQFASNRVRTNSIGLGSSVTIFNGFAKVNQIRASSTDKKVSTEQLLKTKNDISLAVANAYLQVLFGEELLHIAEQQAEISLQQKKRIEKQVAVGQLAQTSLLDADAQLARDEMNLVSRQNDVKLGYLNLFQLLNMSEGGSFIIAEVDDSDIKLDDLTATPQELFESASKNLPDLKIRELQLHSSKLRANIALGRMAPSLTLSGSYGSGYSGANKIPIGDPTTNIVPFGYTASNELVFVENQSYNEFQTKSFDNQIKDNLNQSISLSLSIPLFNNYSATTNYKRERLNYRNSELMLEDEKNNVRQNIEKAYTDALAAIKQYQASKRAVEAQAVAFEAAKIRFEQNQVNQNEFNTSKFEMANAKAEQMRSKYDYLLKRKILEFYQGKSISLQP